MFKENNMRFLIKFSYDGTDFLGFQKQPKKRTIQGCIEEVLKKINNNCDTKFVGTGRTDKGVHALVQYGHCDIDVSITEKSNTAGCLINMVKKSSRNSREALCNVSTTKVFGYGKETDPFTGMISLSFKIKPSQVAEGSE